MKSLIEPSTDLSETENLDNVLAEMEPVIPMPIAASQGAISDEALMQFVAEGSAASLATLYDRYSAIVKALIMRIVHDDAESDDLLQEVFLQVWHQAGNYLASKGKPFGWIVTLARRRAIDRLRKREAYGRAKDRFEVTVDRQPESWVHNRIDEDICHKDLRSFLDVKIRALPDCQRQAVEMAFFKGMSQREIAIATNTPLGTVKTRIELGLRKLSDSVRRIRHMV